MKTIQNIHQNLTSLVRTLQTWSDSLCEDFICKFSYNSQTPKQANTEV